MPQLAQAAQDPNHPANPNHPKVSLDTLPPSISFTDLPTFTTNVCWEARKEGERTVMLIYPDETARRLGQEIRREVGQRCRIRRGGDGGVGFGECYLLNLKEHDGVLRDILMKLDESKELIYE